MLPVVASPAPALVEIVEQLDREERAPRQRKRAERRHRRQPDDPVARLELAWLLAEGHVEEGPHCERVEELLAPLDDAWAPWTQATTVVLRRSCPGPAWPDRERATALLAADWESAVDAMPPLYADQPDAARRVHAELLEAHAALQFAVGEHEAAVDTLREAIALEPSPDRRLRLGLSLMPLGEEGEARAQLAVGLLMDPSQPMLEERARIAVHVLGTPSAPTDSPIAVGEPFPDLQLDRDGGRATLSELEGPLVVDLWATWCSPCLQAMPHLAASEPGWSERGVGLVGVNVDLEVEPYRFYLSRNAPGYDTAWAGPAAMEATGLSALPAVFVLDAEHRVVGFAGGWTAASARHIEALVDEVAPPEPAP